MVKWLYITHVLLHFLYKNICHIYYVKVSEKLCNYYQLCKKGEHIKVAEEINSIRLPEMNMKCEVGNDDVEMQENGVSFFAYV